MKKILILTTLVLTAFVSFANRWSDNNRYSYRFEEQKTVEQTFDVEALPNLVMDGRYSDFIITTWDQPQIDIKVKITVKSDKEKTVQQLMDIISVELTQECNTVTAKTVFNNKINKSFNASVSIKYYVKVPKDVLMDLDTSYGDITIDEAREELKVNIKYGDFKADSLQIDAITKNYIEVIYGNINIDYVNHIAMRLTYGDSKINTCDYIDGLLRYSKIFITNLDNCMLDLKYSDARIEKANKISMGNAAYSDIKVRDLTNRITANNLKYSDLTVTMSTLSPQVTIDSQYSDVVLYIDESASFDYKLDSSYGDIKLKGFFDKKNIEGRGHYGDGERGLLDISVKYGEVDIIKNK